MRFQLFHASRRARVQVQGPRDRFAWRSLLQSVQISFCGFLEARRSRASSRSFVCHEPSRRARASSSQPRVSLQEENYRRVIVAVLRHFFLTDFARVAHVDAWCLVSPRQHYVFSTPRMRTSEASIFRASACYTCAIIESFRADHRTKHIECTRYEQRIVRAPQKKTSRAQHFDAHRTCAPDTPSTPRVDVRENPYCPRLVSRTRRREVAEQLAWHVYSRSAEQRNCRQSVERTIIESAAAHH